ncbi:MAG: hypothetical protein NVS3B20_15850 [Polyangiales bacterium]
MVGTRAVSAQVEKVMVATGRELAQLGDILSNTKGVLLNGETMNVSTIVVDRSVHSVIEQFTAYCSSSALLSLEKTEASEAVRERLGKLIPDASMRVGVLRNESENEGAVACFATKEGSRSKGLGERIKEFASTHDFGALGNFRYAYAKRTELGRTHVITLWTNGSLNASRMFPSSGDAPGTDSTIVPRPPQARRLLTASALGIEHSVRVYESSASERTVAAHYQSTLAGRADSADSEWAPIAQSSPHRSAFARSDGRQLFVSTHTDGAHTYVTLIETGAAQVR